MRGRYLLAAASALLLCLSLGAETGPAWKADWIGAPWDGEEYDKQKVECAPLLRKEFSLDGRVRSAKAYVTGLGFFEFYVNGKRMGDEVLCPNETNYTHRTEVLMKAGIPAIDTLWRGFRVMYMSYDISSELKKGANAVAGVLGNGFFGCGRTRWVAAYGSPRFICQIEITLTDGSTRTIVSDSSWQAHRGPIVLNDIFEGEVYDASLEVPHWNEPGCSSEGWEPVAIRKAPAGQLVPHNTGTYDRVMETLKPVSISPQADGSWDVDFGDYVTGWVRLNNIDLPKGEAVEIEFPIECKGNGVYRYISSGQKAASYAPRFTWWAFRKAVVKGWKGELKPSDICAEVVYTDVHQTGKFECSNPLLNRIDRIWMRTQLDNMHLGVATDCPHRERGPYTGDGQVASPAVMHHFSVEDFYRKWLTDMRDCQDTLSGYVPNGAPWHPGCGGGTAWGAAMAIIPIEHYRHYGDASIFAENYEAMKGQLRFMCSWRREDGTMLMQMPKAEKPNYWMNLGEWCPPYGLASENLVHTWYLWRCAENVAQAARVLGHDEEAEEYEALAKDVADCFHRTFYDSGTGTYGAGSGIVDPSGYGTGTQSGMGDGSNIFALAMGVPEDRYESVIASVKRELEANNGHLNTGIFGTALFFDVLCRNGMAEEAYEAMTKTDFPGYGWWVEQGADTFWEQWNGEASHNHPMMGGGIVWMYTWLAGMDCGQAGYKHIIFRPTPVGDLTWASYSKETPAGKASIKWKLRRGGRMRICMRVPRGSSATLICPDGSTRELRSGWHMVRTRVNK